MPSSVELFCVDPGKINEYWPYAKSLIKAAIEHTNLNEFDEIEKSVLSGDQLLWLAISDRIEAAATTHLIKTSSKPVCVLTACSGTQRERWLPLFEQIENYARAEGCKCVRIYGRIGWQRVLKNYRVEHVILEKSLA